MNVTGYVGGPHQRSSFRESAHSSQTRAISASNSAVIVRVRASKSFFTSITAIPIAHRLRSSTLAPRDRSAPATAPRTGLDAAGSLQSPLGCLAQAARDHAVAWPRGPLVRKRLHAFAPPRSSSGTAAPVPKRRARWSSSASRCPASSHPLERETDDQASPYLQPYGCRLHPEYLLGDLPESGRYLQWRQQLLGATDGSLGSPRTSSSDPSAQ